MTSSGALMDVALVPLKVIPDERGAVLHMLRADSPQFERFGEVYFSEVSPGVVKGWKRHLRMTQHFCVPVGQMKIVLFDSRAGSETYGQVAEFLLGRPSHYALLVIPPMIWYGFQAVSASSALLCNCADMVHDANESERLELGSKEIPYQWN